MGNQGGTDNYFLSTDDDHPRKHGSHDSSILEDHQQSSKKPGQGVGESWRSTGGGSRGRESESQQFCGRGRGRGNDGDYNEQDEIKSLKMSRVEHLRSSNVTYPMPH